jgi:molybdenum cofactor cytidylyltransferase
MITCILLAAGTSRRFGSPKPLADINGRPAVRVLVETLLSAAVKEIIVVLGHRAATIDPFVPRHKRVRLVLNEDYADGMTSSFQTGLRARSLPAKGLMLLPVDLPFVTATTIRKLCRAFRAKRPRVLIPTYQDRAGHPPIFAASLAPGFLKLTDKEPLSTVQHRLTRGVVRLPVKDPGVLLSFNTPAELARLLRDK